MEGAEAVKIWIGITSIVITMLGAALGLIWTQLRKIEYQIYELARESATRSECANCRAEMLTNIRDTNAQINSFRNRRAGD